VETWLDRRGTNVTKHPESGSILQTGIERGNLCGHGGARSVRLPRGAYDPRAR
jgi:hypothetical protein